MSPEDFINAIKAGALCCQKADGIPASFVIAQAALESGWGESLLTRAANNLFGIKAESGWEGERYQITTKEYVSGAPVMVEAWFRKYPSWQASILDHAKVLKETRYQEAFKTTSGVLFGYAVAKAGYATDPNYGLKIARVIHAHNLVALDQSEPSPDPPSASNPISKESSMQKLLALWRVFKAGESVANPTLWKQGAITVTLLSPVILKLSDLFQAFGVLLPITNEEAAMLAGGMVAATNLVVHVITDKDLGFK